MCACHFVRCAQTRERTPLDCGADLIRFCSFIEFCVRQSRAHTRMDHICEISQWRKIKRKQKKNLIQQQSNTGHVLIFPKHITATSTSSPHNGSHIPDKHSTRIRTNPTCLIYFSIHKTQDTMNIILFSAPLIHATRAFQRRCQTADAKARQTKPEYKKKI